MCAESETMCYPNGHFLVYSHCAQWRKKLHMCRKMHNIDRRKKKENIQKITKNWYTVEVSTIFVMKQDFDIDALGYNC